MLARPIQDTLASFEAEGNLAQAIQPTNALAEYEASLMRAPGRLASLYGAARAAQLADDTTKARSYWSQLADLTASGDEGRLEVKEARAASADLKLRYFP